MSENLRVTVDEDGFASGLSVGSEYDVFLCGSPADQTQFLVRDAKDAPIPGALVRVWASDAAESTAQTFQADPSGVVRVSGIASACLSVRVLAKGTANAQPTAQNDPPPRPEPPKNNAPTCDKCRTLQGLIDARTVSSKLKKGSKDKDAIKALQYHLKRFGYDMGTFGPNKDGIDGDYGGKTSDAVYAFMEQAGGLCVRDPNVLEIEWARLVVRKCAEGFRATSQPSSPPASSGSSSSSSSSPPPAGQASEKIRSSNIWVGGKHFVDWFNDVFIAAENKKSSVKTKYGKTNAANFKAIFDHLEGLTDKKEITVNEFIAHFFIMYREIGAQLALKSEGGTPEYFFERRKLSNGGTKASYNGHRNRAPGTTPSKKDQRYAGEQLKAWGIISDTADFNAWNSQEKYPTDPPPNSKDPKTRAKWTTAGWNEVKRRALECDFNKFRGRGLNQLTWRENYVNHASASIKAVLGKELDDVTTSELDAVFKDPRVYVPAFRSFNKRKMSASVMAGVESSTPAWRPVSLAVNPGSATGADLYVQRCTAMFAAMKSAGVQCS